MSVNIGANSFIGYAKEALAGTVINPVTNFLPFESESLEPKTSWIMPTMIQNARVKVTRMIPGQETVGGSIAWSMFPDAGQHLVAGAFGSETGCTGSTPTNSTTLSSSAAAGATTISTAATFANNDIIQIGTTTNPECRKVTGTPTGSGPYLVTLDSPLTFAHASAVSVSKVIAPFTHTITPAGPGVALPTYTIERNVGLVASYIYPGSVVDKLKLNLDSKSSVKVQADIVALKQLEAGNGNAYTVSPFSTVTSTPLHYDQATIGFAAAGTAISGTFTTNSDLSSLEVDLDNGTKSDFTMNATRYAQRVTGTLRDIKGKFSRYFADTSLSRDFDNVTGQAMLISHLDSNGYGYKLCLPQVLIETFKVPIKPADVVYQEVSFQEILDPTTGVDAQLQLLTSSYISY